MCGEILKRPELLGAIVGGVFVIIGWFLTTLTAWIFRKGDQRREGTAFLSAISAESELLKKRYDDSLGKALGLGKGDPSGVQLDLDSLFYVAPEWSADEEYFSVYNASALRVGYLRDRSLQHAIISFYCDAKGLVDTTRMAIRAFRTLEAAHRSGDNVYDKVGLILANLRADYQKMTTSYEKLKASLEH